MSGKSWNQKMEALLKQKKWDMKDWHRAVGLDQWQLEELMKMDTAQINAGNLQKIYDDTKAAKLDKKMMRFKLPVIIVVWTHKGGTGKSTTAMNMSYELSRRGYNVLGIDIDSQSDMSSVLYPEYLNEPDVSFYEAFSLHDDFVEGGYIKHTPYANLDIVPGSAKCEGLEGQLSTTDAGIRGRFWERCLRKIRETNYYDFIFIDMDKTAGLMNVAVLAEADFVLSPLEPTIFAVKAVPPVMAQVEEVRKNNPRLQILGFLYNKVDMRKKKSLPESFELVEEIAPGLTFKSFIKNDANIDNSQREHYPLGVYNRSCSANRQMMEVADELLQKVREKSDKVVR